MKNAIPVAVLVVMLAGCSNETTRQQDSTPVGASTEPAVATAPAEDCARTAFYSPLPDAGIHFDFPFRIARDRVYATDAGDERRGMTIEYLEGDPGQIWSGIKESLETAGFRQVGDITTEPKGTFSKQGKPSMYVEITDGPIQNPTSPKARGSIWISWSIATIP